MTYAAANGCPGKEGLRKLLEKHCSVLVYKLGPDPPALVIPMKLHTCPGTKPIINKTRHYSTVQRTYPANFMTQDADYGFKRKNIEATWSAAPLPVPKTNRMAAQQSTVLPSTFEQSTWSPLRKPGHYLISTASWPTSEERCASL